MGMFSWECKGCGDELITDEYVRLNGCPGVYDGYGRNSGGFDFSTYTGNLKGVSVWHDGVVAWHDVCYRNASPEERDDETPSYPAPNQGFGKPQLCFMRPEETEMCAKRQSSCEYCDEGEYHTLCLDE